MTRQLALWNAGENFFCGEPTFVESPNAKDEDDGKTLNLIILLN